ncbi:phage portal protein [Vibrio cholerae]|nr:phage portal protein [Vibrio cholerae]
MSTSLVDIKGNLLSANTSEYQFGHLLSWFGGTSIGGVEVNANTAIRHSTVYACSRVLEEAVSQLPLQLFKVSNGVKHQIYDHPNQRELTKQPNAFQTWSEMLEQIVRHLNLNGNFYAYVNKRKATYKGKAYTKIVEIIPIPNPVMVQIEIKNNRLIYHVSNQVLGLPKTKFSPDEMLHIKLGSTDGLYGITPITQRAIGLSMAAEQHAESFYENGAIPGVYLSMPQGTKLSPEATERMRDQWNQHFQGVKNGNKTFVGQDGIEVKNLTISHKDAQFLETREFQKKEICSIFRVPPSMIGIGDSKYSNYEQAALSFHRDTLTPLLNRIETRLNLMLDDDLELKLDDRLVLRGDSKTQADVAKIYFDMGSYTINEIRVARGDSPIEGGDVIAVQTNNYSLGRLPDLLEQQAQQRELAAQALKNPPTQASDNNKPTSTTGEEQQEQEE